MVNLRKLKRYIHITFLVAVCLKIRSDYGTLYKSNDEFAAPKEFFSNDTKKVSVPYLKETLIVSRYQQINHSSRDGFEKRTQLNPDANSDTNEIPFLNPLFKKMMEKHEAQLLKSEELRLLAKKLIEDHRNGRLAEINKKVEHTRKKLEDSKPARSIKVSHKIDYLETSLNETERRKISLKIKAINEEQIIYNLDIFGHLKRTDIVVVIQVHNRLENLKHLVASLLEAVNISSCLIIFSHDIYDENINNFVQNITEVRVMQIFFPYSIQLHPDQFPGRDPRDCPWNFRQVSSKSVHCLNEKWPDSFGHYREATFTQIKHHWWWKFLRVFKGLRETRDFMGSFLFLEEDYYVAPDTFHVLGLLKEKVKEGALQKYLIFALGNYLKVVGSDQIVMKSDWIVNKFNMGFVLDRRAFDIIYKCSSSFCLYDDYNWDWTLSSIAKGCANNQLLMLYLKLSRVYHIGSCGTHYKESGCDLQKEVNNVKKRLKAYQKYLFPLSLAVSPTFKPGIKPKKSNGGWGDYRDRQLCLAIANDTVNAFYGNISSVTAISFNEAGVNYIHMQKNSANSAK